LLTAWELAPTSHPGTNLQIPEDMIRAETDTKKQAAAQRAQMKFRDPPGSVLASTSPLESEREGLEGKGGHRWF